ncbi:MAG: PAS domain S-box protein [Sediminibacterium sp.]|nr:PAS domain S-box protein [Sediminibacterium sp.]MBX9778825.1 PAS domain S-box protein [Chitinophagaceae bacterium]
MYTDNNLFPKRVNQHALLETVFHRLPDMVFVYDVKERKFIVRNKVLNELLGFVELSGDTVSCISLRSITHPEDWDKVQNALKHCLSMGPDEMQEVETRCKTKHGNYLFFQTRLFVFEKVGDDVIYLLGISQDITERKYTELQTEKYKARLQELSFITSHEMRHEYAKIQSIVNLLDNRFITDAERLDLISEAKKSIQLINSAIFKLNHKLSFNQNDGFFDNGKEGNGYKRIIFIDDDVLTNVLNKKIVQAILPNMQVEVFLDIDEALSYLRQTDSLHESLVFLDINFPGRGGWDFLSDYSAFSTASNVIVLSSSIDNRDRERARGYKVVIDYITKPLSFDFIKTFFEELKSVITVGSDK